MLLLVAEAIHFHCYVASQHMHISVFLPIMPIIEGHLGCFQFLNIIHNTAINISRFLMHIYLHAQFG